MTQCDKLDKTGGSGRQCGVPSILRSPQTTFRIVRSRILRKRKSFLTSQLGISLSLTSQLVLAHNIRELMGMTYDNVCFRSVITTKLWCDSVLELA